MDFKNLLRDTDCNCLDNAMQDNFRFFARKINKPNVTDKDFKSHWEREKRGDDCETICGLKGLSINEWDENSEKAVIKKFLTTFGISPKHKDSIFVFRFLPEAGLIKYTPKDKDSTHYDFYKSDAFTLDMLENHSILPLKDFIET